MADNDLLFNITAIDHYKAEMDEAYALAQRQAQADQAAINIAQGVEQAEAARAASGRNVAETERQVATETENSTQKIGELSGATKEAGDNARESVQGFESFRGALVTVQAGVALAQEAISGLKQVWDFAKQGAENQQIAASFERTAKSIGGNASEIVAALDAAAKGTVDDEELMQASTRALTLGVAKNGDDLVKVMQLARSAALAFGGDTGQAFETINYAIGNLAPRALKQFGIVVSLKEANDNYAKSLGTTADQLTEEQQRQALLNAVLEQGTKNFGDIANSAATTAEKMKAFETRIANIVDSVKEFAATGAGGIIDIVSDLGVQFDDNASKTEKLQSTYNSLVAQGFDPAAPRMVELRDLIAQVSANENIAAQATENQSNSLNMLDNVARRSADAQFKLAQQFREVEQGARNQADTYSVLDAAMDRTTAKSNLLASSQKIVAGEMDDLKTAMAGALQRELDNFNTKQDDLSAKAATVRDELEKLQATQGRAITVTSRHTLSANELSLAQLKLGEAQTKLSQETDPLKQAELRVQIDKQKESLDSATGAVTSYIDNSKKIKELQGQYDEINKEIEANVKAHEEATKRILFGYAEQQLAVGGLTETEARALDALAVKWGLKSQEDIDAMLAIRDASAALAKDGSINEFVGNVDESFTHAKQKADEFESTFSEAAQVHAGVSVDVTANTKPAEDDVDNAKKKIASEPIVLVAKVSIPEQAKGVAGDTLAERTAQVNKQADTLKGSTQSYTSAADLITNYAKAAMENTGKLADTTTSQVNSVADKTKSRFGDVSNSVISALTNMTAIAAGDFNAIYNLVDGLPTYKEFVYHVKVTGDTPPGAQAGADFYVPPNPRGGSGDYFPVMAAAGEHVVITPTGASGTATKPGQSTSITNNNVYNLYDAMAAKQVTEQQRLERLKSVVGAM